MRSDTGADDDGADSNEATVSIAVVCNVAPTAVDDVATTDESTAVAIPVAGNDRDSDEALVLDSMSILRGRAWLRERSPVTGVVTTGDRGCGDDAFGTLRDDGAFRTRRASR
jgi:hypothetical protein